MAIRGLLFAVILIALIGIVVSMKRRNRRRDDDDQR